MSEHQTTARLTLVKASCGQRLFDHLRDLITIHLEQQTQLSGTVSMRELQYASGESKDGRSSMHFAVRVGGLGPAKNDSILAVTFIVSNIEDIDQA